MMKTPDHWAEEPCVETTTAYGTEVMVPKRIFDSWETERAIYEKALSMGQDLSIGVEDLEISMSMSRSKKDALLVFYEKYRGEL